MILDFFQFVNLRSRSRRDKIAIMKWILIIHLFCFSIFAFADEISDLDLILGTRQKIETGSKLKISIRRPIRSVLRLTIRGYQKFISSQDGPVCNFTPSCSRFGSSAIDHFGAIKGVILTSDRLIRCNGSAYYFYPINSKTGLCDDAIKNYD